MTADLLPCPFCQGIHVTDRHVRDGRQMFCIGCGASVAPTYHGPNNDTLARATDAWNRRAGGWRSMDSVPKDGTHILAKLHREAIEDVVEVWRIGGVNGMSEATKEQWVAWACQMEAQRNNNADLVERLRADLAELKGAARALLETKPEERHNPSVWYPRVDRLRKAIEQARYDAGEASNG